MSLLVSPLRIVVLPDRATEGRGGTAAEKSGGGARRRGWEMEIGRTDRPAEGRGRVLSEGKRDKGWRGETKET